MTLKKVFALCAASPLAVTLAIIFPVLWWLSPFTYMVILPLGAIWLWKSEGRSLWDLGYQLRRDWVGMLAKGLAVGLAIPILFMVIQAAGGWISMTRREESLNALPLYLFSLLVKIGIVVAIEEFVFRGFFLNSLSQRQGFWSAILLSSLLWGIGHLSTMADEGLSPASIIIGLTTFLLWGVALCLSYLMAEKSLWLPYGIHLGVNIGFSLAGWFLVTQYNAPQWWVGNSAWAPESGLIGTVVWLMLALGFYRLTGNDKIKLMRD